MKKPYKKRSRGSVFHSGDTSDDYNDVSDCRGKSSIWRSNLAGKFILDIRNRYIGSIWRNLFAILLGYNLCFSICSLKKGTL